MDGEMRAVVCTDFEEWSIEEVPRPEPAADEAVVEVSRVQLSVTECARFRGEEISGREKIHHQMTEGDGRVFGHEFCGEVVEVGADVDRLEVGDRVYPPAKIPCHECAYCESGYPNLCSNQASIGKGRPGALAEYVAVPAEILRVLPGEVSDAEAAAMQPLASAVLCTHDAGIKTGDVVAVIGTGVMGYQCGQLALEEGAGEVYAVDVVDRKLEHAESRGMIPVDAREVDPVEAIHGATGDIGADVVVAAVGGEQSHMTDGDDPLAQAYRAVRTAGTILQVGHVLGEVSLAPRAMRGDSTRWINPRKGVISTGPNTDTGDLAAELVADGRVSIEEYITHELDGLDSFGEAVEVTADKAEHGSLGPAQIVVG